MMTRRAFWTLLGGFVLGWRGLTKWTWPGLSPGRIPIMTAAAMNAECDKLIKALRAGRG